MTNSINSKVLELQREIPNVSGITIIVEGKKDRKPLEKLGFQNIQEISGKPLNEIFEEVAAKNPEYVAILTDYDREGREKLSILTKLFTSHGIKIHSLISHKIRSLFKIHKIEEFHSITKFMEDDTHGKITSVNDKIFSRSRFLSRRNSRETRRDRGNIRTD